MSSRIPYAILQFEYFQHAENQAGLVAREIDSRANVGGWFPSKAREFAVDLRVAMLRVKDFTHGTMLVVKRRSLRQSDRFVGVDRLL